MQSFILASLCNTPVLIPFALNVYDAYIVINHGVELEEKNPYNGLSFYVLAIKLVLMVFCASQARYYFRSSCKYAIN